MQTFLPSSNFIETAKILDYKRLGKQRLEAIDILYLSLRHTKRDMRDFFNKSDKQAEYLWKRYRNHPAVLMWNHYEKALALYGYIICLIWKNRGYKDNQLETFGTFLKTEGVLDWLLFDGKNDYVNIPYPEWLGNEKFHASHRSNLLRKNKEFYSQYNWKETDDLPYIWPI
jgi:hypothetical protein